MSITSNINRANHDLKRAESDLHKANSALAEAQKVSASRLDGESGEKYADAEDERRRAESKSNMRHDELSIFERPLNRLRSKEKSR